MKNKQQAIDDMIIALRKCLVLQPYDGTVMRGETAERLVNANYGNIPQALTEFADKILFWLYDREKIVTRFVDEEAKITLGRLSELERCREKINEILMEFIPNGDISE